MASEAERCAAVAGCESFGTVLGHAVSNLVASTREVFAAAARDAGSVLLLADDYLAAVGLTVLGYVWARAARAAVSLGEQGRFAGKLHVAGYFFDFLLPATELHLQLVRRAACRPSTTRWPL
jgi:Ser/Thr protein kinase RdoA (MazF antagonist)